MQKELSVQEQIKQMGILYLALIAGQLGMFAVLFFVAGNIISEPESGDGAIGGSSLALIFALFCMMAIGMSFFIYNKRKESGRQLTGDLVEKLTHYRASFMVRAALIEGANLLALIVYFFIESNYVLLLLFAIGIAAFLLIRPTIDRIVEDYQLSSSEQSELRNAVN